MNRHLSSTVPPGTRLVVAIAPAFTIGLVRPSALRSMAAIELNGRPVALAPSCSRACAAPTSWQTSAKTKGFDTLMIENSTSVSPTSNTAPLVAATQMPKSAAGTRANAGWTPEFAPSVFDANRSCASVSSAVTVAASGRCPVETNGRELAARTATPPPPGLLEVARYRAVTACRKMDLGRTARLTHVRSQRRWAGVVYAHRRTSAVRDLAPEAPAGTGRSVECEGGVDRARADWLSPPDAWDRRASRRGHGCRRFADRCERGAVSSQSHDADRRVAGVRQSRRDRAE